MLSGQQITGPVKVLREGARCRKGLVVTELWQDVEFYQISVSDVSTVKRRLYYMIV